VEGDLSKAKKKKVGSACLSPLDPISKVNHHQNPRKKDGLVAFRGGTNFNVQGAEGDLSRSF